MSHTMDKSVTFTGACANEIIPSINRSFVYKTKEGRHVRMVHSFVQVQKQIGYNMKLKGYIC